MKGVADNDVLLKGACYRLLPAIGACVAGPGNIGILGTAVFVVAKRLRKKQLRRGAEEAEAFLRAFVSENEILEPTEEEQQFAAELEFAAQQMSLNLDTGESLLASICITRSLPLLLTGDKRAIVSLEKLLTTDARLTPLEARILCLEQVVLRLIASPGGPDLGNAICAEPEVDVALSICFSCFSPHSAQVNPDGRLATYIDDLRQHAPRTLAMS